MANAARNQSARTYRLANRTKNLLSGATESLLTDIQSAYFGRLFEEVVCEGCQGWNADCLAYGTRTPIKSVERYQVDRASQLQGRMDCDECLDSVYCGTSDPPASPQWSAGHKIWSVAQSALKHSNLGIGRRAEILRKLVGIGGAKRWRIEFIVFRALLQSIVD